MSTSTTFHPINFVTGIVEESYLSYGQQLLVTNSISFFIFSLIFNSFTTFFLIFGFESLSSHARHQGVLRLGASALYVQGGQLQLSVRWPGNHRRLQYRHLHSVFGGNS